MIRIGKKYPLSDMGHDMIAMWNAHGGDIQIKHGDKITILEKTGNDKLTVEFPDGNILSGVSRNALLDS